MDPDAVELRALGALIEARAKGIRIPAALRIFGFGDLDFAAHADPALSTVRIDGTAIGRQAARFILERVAGGAEGPLRQQMEAKAQAIARGPGGESLAQQRIGERGVAAAARCLARQQLGEIHVRAAQRDVRRVVAEQDLGVGDGETATAGEGVAWRTTVVAAGCTSAVAAGAVAASKSAVPA